METNKENIRPVITTKIPLPKDPLPPIPAHLITKRSILKSCDTSRRPLRTLNQANVEDSSTSSQCQEKVKKCSINPARHDDSGSCSRRCNESENNFVKLDTKHVTRRQKYESLDWDLDLLNDRSKNTSIDNVKKDATTGETSEKNWIGASSLPVSTPPIVPFLENKEVKNIKRSLKRPHSRELQGLSPVEIPDTKGYDNYKRRLEFKGQLKDRFQSLKNCKHDKKCLTADYEVELFAYLLSIEKKPLDVPRPDDNTRACVINWLMKVNGPKGNPANVQAALWYFDSILGIDHVPIEKLQLVAAASYWIARKLHGPLISATKMVKLASNAFNSNQLLATEKNILRKLKYPPQPVIPQDFMGYLVSWCDSAHPAQIEDVAMFLYMSGLMVNKNLCEEFPSVVAGAAVNTALVLLGNNLDQLKSCPVYEAILKKTLNIELVSSALRRAVLTVATPTYEYKAPLDLFKGPPFYISEHIVSELARRYSRNVCPQVL